jgi:hypothetical protein
MRLSDLNEEKMRNYDAQRQNELREILVNKIRQEFPDADITVLTKEYAHEHNLSGNLTWRVIIAINTPQRTIAILQPSDEFMIDVDNEFERIFKDGIDLAKRHLSNPRCNKMKIHLANRRIYYQEFT